MALVRKALKKTVTRADGKGGLQEYELTVPEREVKAHGTNAARMRHYRRNEPYCTACRRWMRDNVRSDRAQGKPRGGNIRKAEVKP